MQEQRPSTSPGAHLPSQPHRVMPAQPVQTIPRVSQTSQPPHVSHHANHPVSTPQRPQPHAAPVGQPAARPAARMAATAPLPVDDDLEMMDDAITLEEDGEVAAPAAGTGDTASTLTKKITFNADAVGRQRNWKRKPHSSGTGACRVRTFHGKCSDQGLEYLDDAINAFLDEHPDIEVKFVQSNVAMFDGKFKDFALIVNVWY